MLIFFNKERKQVKRLQLVPNHDSSNDRTKRLLRSSWLMILSLSAIALLGLLSIDKLQTEYSMEQFQYSEHPNKKQEEKIENLFGANKDAPIYLLLQIGPQEKGTWLEEKRIAKMREGTQYIDNLSTVDKVTSIATVEGATTSDSSIQLDPILKNTPTSQWKDRILKDPLLSPNLISKDGRTALIYMELGKSINPNQVKETAGQASTKFQKIFPQSRVHIGGFPIIHARMNGLLTLEIIQIFGIAIIFMIFVLLLVFKNISGIIIPLYITALTNFIVLAFMIFFEFPFTVLSSTLPVIICTIIVSLVMHTMIRFYKEYTDKEKKEKAIIRTMRLLFVPNLLTSLTTCVGFIVLCTADVPIISQYGLVVSVSTVLAWACFMLALPACLMILPTPIPRNWTQKSSKLFLFIPRYSKPIFIGLCISIVMMLIVAKDQNNSATLFHDIPKDDAAGKTTKYIDEKMGGIIPLELALLSPTENFWGIPENIQKMDTFIQKWRSNPEIANIIGLSDFLRAGNIEKPLPKTKQEIAEIYFLYSLSENQILNSYLTGANNKSRVSIRFQDIPSDKINILVESLKADAAIFFSGVEILISGAAVTVHSANKALSEELINGFWMTLLIISLLLMIIFRSIRWTIPAIVANLFPPITLLSCMALFNTPITPYVAIIFSISLGIAFNNTVYLLGRLRSLYIEGRYNSAPIQLTIYKEGLPCILSTLPILVGFLVFFTSNFQMNQTFGMYMVISIISGLIGDLMLMPSMIQLFPNLVPSIKPPKQPIIVDEQKVSIREEAKISVASILILLTLLSGGNAIASENKQALETQPSKMEKNPTAKEILKNIEDNMFAKTEYAKIKMKIIEKNGTKKNSSMSIKRKSKNGKNSVMVRMISPTDIRGTGLLSIHEGDTRNQWLFLPSSKRTRRVSSNKNGGSFLGSELSYEDLSGNLWSHNKSKIIKNKMIDGKEFFVINVVPRNKESVYSKAILLVAKKNSLLKKIQYYDKKGNYLKVAVFSKYKKFKNNIWRARKLKINNVQKKRQTILLLKNIKLNKKIKDYYFSIAHLEDI